MYQAKMPAFLTTVVCGKLEWTTEGGLEGSGRLLQTRLSGVLQSLVPDGGFPVGILTEDSCLRSDDVHTFEK